MLKCKKSFLFAITVIVCSVAFLLCSCGETPSVPENLKMNSSGVLNWTAAESVEYEVSLDDVEYVSVEKNSVDLLTMVKSTGTNKIYVRAKLGNNRSESAVYEFQAVQLTAPQKAVIDVNPVTHEEQFVWNEVDNANKYYYSVNGGKWVSTSKTTFTPLVTGDFTISVKARGYANKNVLYLESAQSPVSDTLNFLLGPALMSNNINCISWETADDFDSYNLWIDGVKVKENVTSPINLVTGDNPVLTKTGEYDIQIEALKGERSAWSNIYEEFGTSNINEKEIYSFDNRIYKLTDSVYNSGISLTNERYHGDSGYSLKLYKVPQFNLIKYANDINDINFRDITSISYWIYIESVEDYDSDSVPAVCLPAVKQGYPQDVIYVSKEGAPIGEWTKITVDCRNTYENVLIMCCNYYETYNWPDGQYHAYTMYIDDITYDISEDAVDDYDYKLCYTAACRNLGSWFDFNLTEIDVNEISNKGISDSNNMVDYSNQNVLLEMEICGTVTDSITASVGIAEFIINDIVERSLPNKAAFNDAFRGFVTIDKVKINSLTWNKIYIECPVNEFGKIYLACGRTADGGSTTPFDIYIRNISVKEFTEGELSALEIMTSPSSYQAYPYAGTPSMAAKLSSNSFRQLGGMDGFSGRRGFMLKKTAIKSLIDLGCETLSFTITTSSYEGNPVADYIEIWIGGGAVDWLKTTPSLGNSIFASGSTVEINLVKMYEDIGDRDSGLGFTLKNDESTYSATAAYITLSEMTVA